MEAMTELLSVLMEMQEGQKAIADLMAEVNGTTLATMGEALSPEAHFEEPSADGEYVAEEGFEDYYQDPEAEYGPDDYFEGLVENPFAPEGLP